MNTMKLFVECYTNLFFVKTVVSSMGLPKRSIIHAGNRGKVVNEVMNNPIAFGMIDEDPQSGGQPSHLRRFRKKDMTEGLKLLEDSQRKQILVIEPRIEEWFLHLASQTNILMSDFNLTNRAEDLHRIRIDKNRNYQEFVGTLCRRCKEIKTMSSWIKSFVKVNTGGK